MPNSLTVVSMFLIGILAVTADFAFDKNYPDKPIRLVTNAVGGGSDFLARMIAPAMAAGLGQQLIIENRSNVTAPTEIVARAASDGYTLLLNSNAMWILPFLRSRVPYDPVNDFSPITLATRTFNVLTVHPSLGVASVKELIALAKIRAGELNYASGGTGSATHLAAALFTAMAGIKMTHVPYNSNSQAVIDLVAGRVQMSILPVGSVMPQVRVGRLKALAITNSQPSGLVPELPTVADSGLPGYESGAVFAMFAPGKTAGKIISRLNQEICAALDRPESQEKFFTAGVEVVGSNPQQLATKIKSEMAIMGKVIKDAGMRDE